MRVDERLVLQNIFIAKNGHAAHAPARGIRRHETTDVQVQGMHQVRHDPGMLAGPQYDHRFLRWFHDQLVVGKPFMPDDDVTQQLWVDATSGAYGVTEQFGRPALDFTDSRALLCCTSVRNGGTLAVARAC